MNPKEHRIYKYMSEPIRIIGLTLDEIVVLLGSMFLLLFVRSFFLKACFLFLGTFGVYGMKKFKKLVSGFSLKSHLHWSLGIRFGLSKHWPDSWKRIWLP